MTSISLSKKKKPVLAIASQFNPRESQINLILAKNQTVQKQLGWYYEHIWGKLSRLSTEHAKHRGLKPNLTGNKSLDPHLDQDFSLQVEIFRDINMYFLEKQTKYLEIYLGYLNQAHL